MIDRKILTWNFFVSRFEVLINEVQNYNSHQKHIQESILLLKREDSPPDNFGINGILHALAQKRTVTNTTLPFWANAHFDILKFKKSLPKMIPKHFFF